MTVARRSCLAATLLLATAPIAALPSDAVPSPSAAAAFARCEAEASKQFKTPAFKGQLPKAGLKRIRGAKANLPDVPPGTRGSGPAIHEVLIGPDGKVQSVWPVREPTFEPPFPAFAQAIVDALETWEYEPYRPGGSAVPVCMIVSTNINWR
jgi:hypothetical protein